MPNVNIYEKDNTSGASSQVVYTVLIPGVTSDNKDHLYTSSDSFKVGDGFSDKIIKILLDNGLQVLEAHASAEAAINNEDFFKKYEDKGKYDIDFILGNSFVTGSEKEVAQYMIKSAATRGDCVAIIDVPSDTTGATSIATWCKSLSVSDINKENAMKYGAAFAPTFKATDIAEGTPASVAYLSCFGTYVNDYASWFAFAGSTRGVLPFTNVELAQEFGDADIEILQTTTKDDKCCNVLAEIRPYGNLVWGNRTLHPIENNGLIASDFLNIRNLVNAIKKQLYRTARKYTFEPNDDVLWINFTNDILPLLNQMKSNRGIRGFSIKKVKTDKKATLKAVITISPIEAVEDFDLTIDLVNSVVEE